MPSLSTEATLMLQYDFNDLLEHLSVSSGRLLIMGDFNFHVNEPSRDHLAVKFLDFLDS